MHIVFILFGALLALVMPDMAWADSIIKPSSGNTWDLYVFGNGRVVFDILNSVKLLMVPDAGSTGFRTLLMLMGTLGFLVLAIAAGFDPGKNLIRMFTYIIVVWVVSYGSTSLTAHVNVNDLVVNRDGIKDTYTVDRVPALVALPAALTSQVGYYFTRVIETYFSMPGEFKVAGEAGGQFNLFAKMVQESNEFVFTDTGLKQTMQSYVTDCVVPAIARGKFRGSVRDPVTGAVSVKQGGDVLAQSANLMEAFETAKHNSIMTKVYASSLVDNSNVQGPPSPDATPPGFGTVVTCAEAYPAMKTMMETNAQALLEASSAAYRKAGIMTPYETLFSSMLAGASAPGGQGSSYSRPSGLILQQSMLNSMSGAFRQAAIHTGNNELMTAAALSQAEQNQRSAWAAGFATFNNMMGYVFTVLQAFIFAITPMVIVAMLIPGLGRSIVVNYAQILIWLTLWMPMLALINYIITLFGTESIGSSMLVSGGVSMANKGIMSERTNDLIIAAQFLGTMTPMLTWGLVKGAMAFTEFISAGVGNAFASQAGAAAASGNLSLNNLSMDNTSMNKFNTAMSSTVGTQGTNAFSNAGALLVGQDMGGGTVTKSGSQVSAQRQASDALSKGISESDAVSKTISDATSQSSSVSEAFGRVLSKGTSSSNMQAMQQMYQSAVSFSKGDGAGKSASADERANMADQAAAMAKVLQGLKGEANAHFKLGFDKGPVAVGGGVSAGVQRAFDQINDASRSGGNTRGAGTSESVDLNKQARTESGGYSTSGGTSSTSGTTASDMRNVSKTTSNADSRVMGEALNRQEAVTKSLSATKSVVDNFGVASDLDMQAVNQRIEALQRLQSDMSLDAAGLEKKGKALAAELTGNRAATQAAFDAVRTDAAQQTGAIAPSAAAGGGGLAQLQKDVKEMERGIVTDINKAKTRVTTQVKDLKQEANTFRKETGPAPTMKSIVTHDMKDHTGGTAPSPVKGMKQMGGLIEKVQK